MTRRNPSRIGLLLLLLLTTVATLEAFPSLDRRQAPDSTLVKPAVCANSNGGSWLVGLNDKGQVTVYSINADGSEGALVSVQGAPMADAGKFMGVQCYENVGMKRLFFVSDFPTGWIDLNRDNHPWVTFDDRKVAHFTGMIDPVRLSAVGLGTGAGVTSVSIFKGAIHLWDVQKADPITIPTTPALPLKPEPLLAKSNDYIWGLFNNASGTFITAIGTGNIQSTLTYNVNGSAKLIVPMASGTKVATIEDVQGDGAATGSIAVVKIWDPKSPHPIIKMISAATTNSLIVVNDDNVIVVDPIKRTSVAVPGVVLGTDSGKVPAPNPSENGVGIPKGDEAAPKASKLPVILGSIAAVLVVIGIASAFLVLQRRKRRGGRAKHLFPATRGDDTLLPLGLYHQNRDNDLPPEPIERLQHDLANLGYDPRPSDIQAQSRSMAPTQYAHAQQAHQAQSHHLPYPSNASHLNDSRYSVNSRFDETIPVEAKLMHHQPEKHTAQGLTHSISVSSTTSKFARRHTKTGKRFEEKIQLQVIQYEVDDAHTISPHGQVGRLVLGTYHIISPARPARSMKAQGPNVHQGVARSGTVLVRRSRLDFGPGGGTRSPSPVPENHAESSMLLTDVENQHTFETATLKWYMTELHWKREAALLKHLKSPIFVVELLESYAIPALQLQTGSYPFVNVLGACSSLLSEVGPIRTAQHARAILRSISGAVEWCHRHGVVHLNLQPGSFFLEDGIDPKAEDASWKLWDFTCARFIGEAIGVVGGGGVGADVDTNDQQQQQQLKPDAAYPFLNQGHQDHQLDRIGGNPLPAAYTAPELLEAWRAGDTTFPVEAGMDTWALGCVYYEILAGQPLFQNEAEAWSLVGGWSGKDRWTSKDFKVPYPPVASAPTAGSERPPSMVQDSSSPFARSQILDPSGSIAQLLQGMLCVNADERLPLETIMEKIY
ncbi:hypothetical protein BGZ94_009370 [Podila epigama]|nr:hypothetical protein BGZ94_009370 [Podila epigama]